LKLPLNKLQGHLKHTSVGAAAAASKTGDSAVTNTGCYGLLKCITGCHSISPGAPEQGITAAAAAAAGSVKLVQSQKRMSALQGAQ
jgi:hypothetical protein